MKVCRKCTKELNVQNCYKSDWVRGGSICSECRKVDRNSTTKEKNAAYTKVKNLKLKKIALDICGKVCVCCGDSKWSHLSIDHKNNDGAKERRETCGERAGASFYRLIKLGKVDTSHLQTMCMNCNCAKFYHGFCVHEQSNNCLVCGNPNPKSFKLYTDNETPICVECLYNLRKPSTSFDKWLAGKRATLKQRLLLLNSFANISCSNCGSSNMLHLTLDHINKDGAIERRLYHKDTNKLYRDIVCSNSDVSRYRILCYNCNTSLGFFGKFSTDLPANIEEYIHTTLSGS